MTDPRSLKIATLNDRLRVSGIGGRRMLTRGVMELGSGLVARIVRAVAAFDEFSPDNDPYGEHDFGVAQVEDFFVLFKIDYYDLTLRGLSPDPADPAATERVMTIMLAEEY